MIKKIYICLLSILLCSQLLVAQDIIGVASHRFQYVCKYKKDSLKQGYFNDLFFLDTGNNLSRFYSQITHLRDSVQAAMLAEGENIYVIQEELRKYGRGNLYIIVKTPERIVFSDRLVTSRFYYTEDTPDFQWKLLEDTCSILGYLCQKATGNYGGRTWIAWFTSAIPLSDGPYKFAGLPGLIVKISDDRDFFIFELKGVENRNTPIMQAFGPKYQKIDKKRYLQICYRVWTEGFDPSGRVTARVTDAQGRDVTDEKIPYIPIELY